MVQIMPSSCSKYFNVSPMPTNSIQNPQHDHQNLAPIFIYFLSIIPMYISLTVGKLYLRHFTGFPSSMISQMPRPPSRTPFSYLHQLLKTLPIHSFIFLIYFYFFIIFFTLPIFWVNLNATSELYLTFIFHLHLIWNISWVKQGCYLFHLMLYSCIYICAWCRMIALLKEWMKCQSRKSVIRIK